VDSTAGPGVNQSVEVTALKTRIAKLEKDLAEQDKLIKGYQTENEKLYRELRVVNDSRRKETAKLEGERNELKVNLIQERLAATTATHTKQVVRRSAETNTSLVQHSPEKKVILPDPVESASNQQHYNDRFLYMSDKLAEMEAKNKHLTQIVDYYEKNQRQIEMDARIVEVKNKEIRMLGEKVRALEQGRHAPEYVKELRRLKGQLKEMELVVKRMRSAPGSAATQQTSGFSNGSEPINLSLDYYEQRIEGLEGKLREKTEDLERLNRMWKQKFYMLNEYKSFESGEEFGQEVGFGSKQAVENDLERNYR
jgi:protein QN1